MIERHMVLLENTKKTGIIGKEELKASKVVVRFMQLSVDGKVAKEQDWNDLYRKFSETFPTFTQNLQRAYKNISKMEIRVCMLSRLDFSPSEIGILVSRERSTISNICTRLYSKVYGKEQPKKRDFDDWIQNL